MTDKLKVDPLFRNKQSPDFFPRLLSQTVISMLKALLKKRGAYLKKKSKSAVADGKALSFARTQLGHHVSLLIGSDFIS